LKRIKLKGIVFSGGGDGKKFIELPWVKRQITEKLGFTPYPGTLNVKLIKESLKKRIMLKEAPSVKICPAEGYRKGAIFKAFTGPFECAIIVPEVPDYPKDVLEIIASVNLRDTLHLEDGDEIAVTVKL